MRFGEHQHACIRCGKEAPNSFPAQWLYTARGLICPGCLTASPSKEMNRSDAYTHSERSS